MLDLKEERIIIDYFPKSDIKRGNNI